MKWSGVIGVMVLAAWGLVTAQSPLWAQNYSPGDSIKWRGMGAQTQKAMDERSQFLQQKKQGSQGAQRSQQPQSKSKPMQQPQAKSKSMQQPQGKQTKSLPR